VMIHDSCSPHFTAWEVRALLEPRRACQVLSDRRPGYRVSVNSHVRAPAPRESRRPLVARMYHFSLLGAHSTSPERDEVDLDVLRGRHYYSLIQTARDRTPARFYRRRSCNNFAIYRRSVLRRAFRRRAKIGPQSSPELARGNAGRRALAPRLAWQ
jgi:hypothetical protein